MKKLLALLMALLPGFARAADAKLGSEGDLIRQMLFASQSLKEQVARSQLDGTPGPFQSIADASKLVDAGKKEEAVALLRSILDITVRSNVAPLGFFARLRMTIQEAFLAFLTRSARCRA